RIGRLIVAEAKLERVIGCTATSRCSIAVDENKGIVAYPAGSTVVLHNPKNNAQAHIIGTSKNNITCLSFAPCGKYVVTGECGYEPRIRVWELYDASGQFAFSQVANIKYHQLGISCVRFTAGGTQIISVGNQHDKAIAIWDWRKERRIAENRLTSRVNAMDETDQGTYVTAGVRHVKFWHLTATTDDVRVQPLQGRSAILADQRNNTFVDVCCVHKNRTFAITETRMLVEFNDKKLVSTYDLNGETPFSLVRGSNEILIGFGNGIIRSFDIETIAHKFTYCKPHHLHCDVAKGISADALLPASHPTGSRFPDVRALCCNRKSGVLTAVYGDRSIYSWQQLADGGAISKISSQLFHAAPIFALEVYPTSCTFLPSGTFITGAADETIRIWNVDQRTKRFDQERVSSLPQTNVYSEELKKVIYLSDDWSSLVEEKVLASSSIDLTTGAKSLRISPDGQHLACGGRDGNLRIFDLTLPNFPSIAIYEAHEAEIMCVEYSDPRRSARYLLATGSRDRLIHLYDPRNGYRPLASVDDHTGAINSVAFTSCADDFLLLSCASDKVVIVRKMKESEPTIVRFDRVNQIAAQFGLNSMVMGVDGVVTACQDRHLRTFSFQGKLMKQVKGATSDDGQLTKVRLDPSGTFAATVCTDRNVYIVEVSTGECAAMLSGLSESVTDVAFTSDCRRLIVVSYNGCIFVWRLSNLLSNKMNEKMKRMLASPGHITSTISKTSTRSETPDSLIGSGSEAASEEIVGSARVAKVKDSESEFGSLNSVRITGDDDDDDDDSCIGQSQGRVILKQTDLSTDDTRTFELKRTATEVVRRSNSGLLSLQDSSFDIASAANDFSDGESVSGNQPKSKASLTRVGNCNTYTTSRSMSNLRPAPSTAPLMAGSPRRPRKKWDMSGDAVGYAAPLSSHQEQQNAQIYGAYNRSAVPIPSLPSGFMTMNGTHIYHSPNVATAPTNVSMFGVSQLSGQRPSTHDNTPLRTTTNTQTENASTAIRTSSKPSDLPLQQTSPGEASFHRISPQRCSLTKRFILNTSATVEPRTVWTPPAISARRSASNMQCSTQTAGAASALIKRQSELSTNGGRLYQQNTAGVGAMGSEDSRISRRARTMHRLKNRRMTTGTIEQGSTDAVDNSFTSHKEEDYTTSDLHLRSRSQSPSQLALNALGDDRVPRCHRQDSDMSTYSTATMTSSRLTPASSRTNLRAVGTTSAQSSQALNKLNEMRDRLRKSQENLATPIGDETNSASTSLLKSRSRSIGNLRFSAAPAVSAQRGDRLTACTITAHDGTQMPGPDSENLSDNSSTLLSTWGRHITRSMGNLHNNQEAPELTDDANANAYVGPPRTTPRRLAQTIENLKKASNPDLTQLCEDSLRAVGGDLDTEAYASSASFPRNQRGKGAVQKRVERYHPHSSRVSRDTTSGESDSNASDANSTALLQGTSIGGPQLVAKRYFATVNGPSRSVSSVEGTLRPGMLQSARRVFEQQRHGSVSTPRRAPNYLAQKLAGGAMVGPDVDAEEYPRQQISPNEAISLPDFDSKAPQSKQMARHVAECLKQWNTALDMVLQARQLLESAQNLPADDREMMLRILDRGIRTGRKRLDVVDDRYEPDGGRSDSPSSLSSQRPNATHASHDSAHPQQVTPTAVTGDVDPMLFFQQHGHQLLALLQQNMAKQN
uniref:Mitogen-activated protein kinase-binding protein 1 n=1 Tax=Parascaris univalens TaxID=6257 RepID=A0A915B6I2_PARUN